MSTRGSQIESRDGTVLSRAGAFDEDHNPSSETPQGRDTMDRHMALKLYQHAVDQDLPAAMFCLGEAARDGAFVPYSMPEDGEY